MNKSLIVVILVLVVGLGGYFLFKNSPKSPASDANQNQPPTGFGVNNVAIKNFAFDPDTVTIKKGTTVTWRNDDSVDHSIKSDIFNSHVLKTGGNFDFTFLEVGTFDYSCGIHPSMKGKIIVEQ